MTTVQELIDRDKLECEHNKLVADLAKPGQDILDSLTPEKCDLWHHMTGIETEVGELFDAIKKHVIYGKELDRPNVIEEIGDLEFYLRGLRRNLSITREETLEANCVKLRIRYGEKYSNEAAQKRADKLQA